MAKNILDHRIVSQLVIVSHMSDYFFIEILCHMYVISLMYIFFNIFFYTRILDFLVKQLEIKACKYKVSNISIITGFLELGIAMEDLLDIYDK